MSIASESSVANDENDEQRVKPTGGQRSKPGVRWAEGGGVEGRLLVADAGVVGSGRLEREGVVGCDGQGSEDGTAGAGGAEAAEGAEPYGKGVEGEAGEDGAGGGEESDGKGTCGAEGRARRR